MLRSVLFLTLLSIPANASPTLNKADILQMYSLGQSVLVQTPEIVKQSPGEFTTTEQEILRPFDQIAFSLGQTEIDETEFASCMRFARILQLHGDALRDFNARRITKAEFGEQMDHNFNSMNGHYQECFTVLSAENSELK
jgi:hypothetical protein